MSQNSVRTFGKYEIVEELGRGAMGVVYKARDPLIGRLVALKTVMPSLLSDADLLKRFYREAQSAGRLQHPNIVIIHDLGEADGLPYIAMELVDGESLQAIIARQVPLPLATRLTIMVQICRGLGYAHQRGVVHRDVKPANILVKPDGTVKVVDFGIVHLADTGMTSSGMILGTVSYMAPEQLRGETIDSRADVFAVGAVLYELLSYRKAFEGPNVTSVMFKIATGEPTPLVQIVPGIPSPLDDAVRKCLRKDREERFQTLEDLALELEPLARKAQREVVDSLVEQGRALLKEDDFVGSEEALRSALELDSSDENAKALMSKAQAGLKTLRNSPRVRECLSEGRGWLERGKYQEASKAFEEILRLDSHHGEARELLLKSREALAKAEEVRRRLDGARRALSEGQLTVAESEAHETLQIDATQVEAVGILENIRQQRAAQQKRGRSKDGSGEPDRQDLPAGAGQVPVAATDPSMADGGEPPLPLHTMRRVPKLEGPEAGSKDVPQPAAAQQSRTSSKRVLIPAAAGLLIVALGVVGYFSRRDTRVPSNENAQAASATTRVDAPSLGAISGHVTGLAGAALNGVKIQTSDSSGHILTADSAADGGFRFAGLRPGSYVVKAQPPAGYSASSDMEVKVSGSQEQQIDLSLSTIGSASMPGAEGAPHADESTAQVSESKPAQLDRPPQSLTPQPVKLATHSGAKQAQLSSATQGAGDLAVSANVEGAKILLDGRDTGEVTPHAFSALSAGPHHVTLIKDSYGTVQGDFTVPAGGSGKASLQLSPPSGVLEITSVPSGAEVSIDGKAFGKTPVSTTLPAGPHQWQVVLGSVAKQGTVNISADGIAQKSIEFTQ